MGDQLKELIGWLPAIIFPTATSIQLVALVTAKSAKGISLITWILFFVANLGLYIYTDKLLEIQSILGLLFTAILDLVIIVLIVTLRVREKNCSK